MDYLWEGVYFPRAGIEYLIQLELSGHASEWIPLSMGYWYVCHTQNH